MKIPKGMSEDEVVEVITKVSKRLSYKFRFGYYETDDIEQEAFILALDGLESYDNKRPLENFLYIHIKNRLINFKRNNYERKDLPCFNCPLNAYVRETDGCTAYVEKEECNLYSGWLKRNANKKNILMPINLGSVQGDTEQNMQISNDVEHSIDALDMQKKIEKKLPLNLRKNYIKMKNGVRLSKQDKEVLMDFIHEVLGEIS